MPSKEAPAPEPEVICIRDPEINVAHLVGRIRADMAVRSQLPPLAAALGMVRLAEQRNALLTSLKDLQRRIREYGRIGSRQQGWRARLQLFIKRTVRKLILRHVLQQRRVHVRLLDILQQFTVYLEEQDRYYRAAVDLSERQWRQATAAAPPRRRACG
jgi:hypothetical protein